MNSLASSASSGATRTIFSVRCRKSAAARSKDRLVRADDDLGQRAELLHGPSLGDALGAEGHVDRLAQAVHEALDHPGDAREHRAAQDQELAVVQLVGDALERTDERLGGRG